MKIALIGSAPSSIKLAPYADPSWEIWGCSPGAYSVVPRNNAWFETHRWEPGVIGKGDTQKPWFSPEYVAWLYQQPRVWGFDLPADMPGAAAIPHEKLRLKYGDYNFTSTLAWMFAIAFETILEARENLTKPQTERDTIGLWGVDMSATEEYGYQRSGCQFFCQLASFLGIDILAPPESDLLTPPPLYGLHECTHKGVKFRARRAELETRLAVLEQQRARVDQEYWFVKGALDDLTYMQGNWLFDGTTPCAADFGAIFSAAKVGAE